MRPKLPTLGYQPRKSPFGKVLGIALIAGLVAGGYWYWKKAGLVIVTAASRAQPGAAGSPVAGAQPGVFPGGDPTAATGGAGGAAASPNGNAPVAAAPAAPVAPPPPMDKLAQAGLKRAQVVIDGPLESALVNVVGKEAGPALTQVVNRALVWWVTVPNDLRRGDTLDVLYQDRAPEEPLVVAVRFASSKTGKTFRAYRYKSEADVFPRMYQPSGEELEMRLESSPLDDYEQITSLIRDGRRHKGVDFKTPVGTKVKAPFDGHISRKNWNWRSNGNCLALTEAGGRRVALFLHLSELTDELKVGSVVKRGQILADSGNTGHSFAPHLHYQLEAASGKVLDPFESQTAIRRKIPATAMSGLTAEIERLDGLFTVAVAAQ